MALADAILLLVVIYLRVSTEDQKLKGYSLPEQRDLCRKKAEALAAVLEQKGQAVRLEIVEFEDAISGDFLDRPALDAAREYVRANKPRWFICLDPDRFSRNLMNQLIVTEDIEKAETDLQFVQHDYQKTAEGQMFYQMRGSIAQYEKAKILERTTRGRRGKLRKGLVASYVPLYGYQYNKVTSLLDSFEEEARWVRQIFQWGTERVRLSDMVDRLNAAGVPSKRGGRWYTSSVRSILNNTSYLGQLVCNKYDWTGAAAQMQLPKQKRKGPIRPKLRPQEEWIYISIPVLIEPDVYAGARQGIKTQKAQAKKGTQLLSGLVRCSICEGPVHYVANKANGYVLRCFNRYPRPRELKTVRTPCPQPHVRYTIIEQKVWDEVKSWVREPDVLEAKVARDLASDHNPAEVADIESKLSQAKARIASLRQEQVEVIRTKTKGLIDQELADLMLGQLKPKLENMNRSVGEWEDRLSYLHATQKQAKALREQLTATKARMEQISGVAGDVLDNLDASERQAFLRTWVRKVVIRPGRLCDVHPMLPRA